MLYFQDYEREPTTSLNQVLWFIRFYGDINEIDFKGFTFEDGIEFKRDFQLDYFESLLQLHLESAINLWFHGQTRNEFWRKNKELEETLKKYLDRDLVWKPTFDLLFLRLNWDSVKDLIKQYDCFWYEIRILGRRFLELMFCKISQDMWYLDMDRKSIAQSLYQYIIDSTDGKHNYNNEIELKYRFDDYLESRRLVLPVLVEMEELWRLKIDNISIKNEYITFTISNIIDISEKIFQETIEKIPGKFYKDWEPKKIEKVEYTQEGIKINDSFWKPKDSQKTEDFLKLLSIYFSENPNIKYIHISKLNDFYEKKKSLLKTKLTLNEKNIKNSYMKTFHEKLVLDYEWNFLQMGRWLIEANEDFKNESI